MSLDARVTALENAMSDLKTLVSDIDGKVTDIHATFVNVTSVSNAVVFAKRHGPRLVAFLTGILAAAGMGNPNVLTFINKFFGN